MRGTVLLASGLTLVTIAAGGFAVHAHSQTPTPFPAGTLVLSQDGYGYVVKDGMAHPLAFLNDDQNLLPTLPQGVPAGNLSDLTGAGPTASAPVGASVTATRAGSAAGAPASNAPGGLIVTAALSTSSCSGPVIITVTVVDVTGAPVPNAALTGLVAFRTGSAPIDFQPTDAAGMTVAIVDTGQPEHGSTGTWTVSAAAGRQSGSAMASCQAP